MTKNPGKHLRPDRPNYSEDRYRRERAKAVARAKAETEDGKTLYDAVRQEVLADLTRNVRSFKGEGDTAIVIMGPNDEVSVETRPFADLPYYPGSEAEEGVQTQLPLEVAPSAPAESESPEAPPQGDSEETGDAPSAEESAPSEEAEAAPEEESQG